jgi:cytidylate kinase
VKPFVVAVDGPAGAGKSTVSQGLARALGFRYVDTGAMYRVVGVLARERGLDLDDAEGLSALCARLHIVFEDQADGIHTCADGRDLTRVIRSADAGQWASKVSTVPRVRERLVAMQRVLGAPGEVVMEGRDIGTVVFPDAPVKIYLTASVAERASRRCAELAARGVRVDPATVEREIRERDARDQGRAHSPLRPAADAVVVDTTRRPVEEVVRGLRALVTAAHKPCNC